MGRHTVKHSFIIPGEKCSEEPSFGGGLEKSSPGEEMFGLDLDGGGEISLA